MQQTRCQCCTHANMTCTHTHTHTYTQKHININKQRWVCKLAHPHIYICTSMYVFMYANKHLIRLLLLIFHFDATLETLINSRLHMCMLTWTNILIYIYIVLYVLYICHFAPIIRCHALSHGPMLLIFVCMYMKGHRFAVLLFCYSIVGSVACNIMHKTKLYIRVHKCADKRMH